MANCHAAFGLSASAPAAAVAAGTGAARVAAAVSAGTCAARITAAITAARACASRAAGIAGNRSVAALVFLARREEIINREFKPIKDFTRIDRFSRTGAIAFALRHANIIRRHEQLNIALQTHD